MRQSGIRAFCTEMNLSACALDHRNEWEKGSAGDTATLEERAAPEEDAGGGDSMLGGMVRWKKRRTVAAAPADMDDGLTDYERLRAENIRRNNQILESLGIETTKAELERRGRGNAASSSAPRVKSKIPVKPTLPVRRSARVREREGDVAESGSIREDASEEGGLQDWLWSLFKGAPKPMTEPPCYDESLVVRYTCGWASSMSSELRNARCRTGIEAEGVLDQGESASGLGAPPREIVGFQLGGRNLCDSALTRIYTMDAMFSGEGASVLLAAAGHQGRISIYGTTLPASSGAEHCGEEIAPLLSWKGGAGWISHVQFLSTQHLDESTLLLSSSNDRRVVLWDVNKQHQQLRDTLPRVVVDTTELHSGGIFSMHEFQGQIATSSKDSSVSVAVLADGKFQQTRSMSGFHSGAVKGVRFRDSNVLASCGLNGSICLLDLRLREPCTKTVESSHQTAVNVVEWNSWQNNLLLSASNDPKIVIHDIRKPSSHLHKLSGHVHPTLTRCKNIYRPTFVHNGKAVATPGEGSNHISLYSVATGNPISRGHVGFNPTMVMSTCSESRCEQLWVASKQVSLFLPVWKDAI